MLQRVCSCARSEVLSAWKTAVAALSVQLLNDQFAYWHSCDVQVQAMGCASAALWPGQLCMHEWSSFEAHWPG